MAKKKNVIPSEFEDVLGSIYSNAEEGESIANVDDLLVQNSPLDDKTEEPPVNTEDGKENKDDTHEPPAKEDNSEIPDDILNKQDQVDNTEPPASLEDNTPEEPSDADVIEAQQVGLLFDAIGQSLGWNMADIDEKDRPLTVDDLTQYFAETVRQNSVPEYADERIQALDEYVKNGGAFEDFYKVQKEGIQLESIDLEDESNQKAVVKELMQHDGYTDEQISKRIARYEEADMLYEESEDALERLKTIRKAEEEAAILKQQEYAKAQEEQSKAFFLAVTQDINNLTNIRGVAIPKEDRKALFEYIFKVDQDGVSQYQKDFNKNLSKNLIESAYFTMKADTLISNAKKNGESSAAEKLRNILRHSQKNHSAYNVEDKQKSVTDLLAGAF